MSDPSRICILGPLEPFAPGFASELARQGYVPRVVVYHLRLMADVSRWLTEQDLQVSDLTREAERFLQARRAAGYTRYWTGQALRPLLTYLRSLGVVAPTPLPVFTNPVDVMLARYRHYLTSERGLGAATARGYLDAVRPFLRTRLSPDGLHVDLEHLCGADVTAFVVAHTPTQSRHGAKMTVCSLRSVLQFLHLDGAITTPLVAAVPSVAGWRLAGLPKSVDASDVQRLLASCDRHTPDGSRDFAILTTLARIGLRAGEVAALRLDDLDWRLGEIVVHGKGPRVERLPLPTDVGAALAAYLRRGRPSSVQDRAVFVRCMAPHRGLTPTGITQIVAAAAQRAGLGTIYAHRLRHFAAMQTLRAGGSFAEIKQLLRHRLVQTTAIYAKVDREALRTIARPWPGGAA
jgi:site-specific recombinase XerD